MYSLTLRAMHSTKSLLLTIILLIMAACSSQSIEADKEAYFIGSWNMGSASTIATFKEGNKATFSAVPGTCYWAYDAATNELILNTPEERFKIISSEKNQFTVVSSGGQGVVFRRK